MSDAIAQARLRLWLHSERAMGLRSVCNGGGRPNFSVRAVAPAAAIDGGAHKTIQVARPRAAPAEAPPRAVKPSIQGEGGEAKRSLPVVAVEMPAVPGGPLGSSQKKSLLEELDNQRVKGCVLCGLSATRTHTVFGEGDPDAKIMFIGEGPGETEDLSGRPFVGRAGNLLDKMIAGMGLTRGEVFIANIVKCRPPNNRTPAPDEVAACTPYLVRQLEIIRPRVIVTLGLPASKYMLQANTSMGRLRGQWHLWRDIKVMPTYHPSYLLRAYTEENRAAVWSDLKQVMAEVGLPPKK